MRSMHRWGWVCFSCEKILVVSNVSSVRECCQLWQRHANSMQGWPFAHDLGTSVFIATRWLLCWASSNSKSRCTHKFLGLSWGVAPCYDKCLLITTWWRQIKINSSLMSWLVQLMGRPSYVADSDIFNLIAAVQVTDNFTLMLVSWSFSCIRVFKGTFLQGHHGWMVHLIH